VVGSVNLLWDVMEGSVLQNGHGRGRTLQSLYSHRGMRKRPVGLERNAWTDTRSSEKRGVTHLSKEDLLVRNLPIGFGGFWGGGCSVAGVYSLGGGEIS